MVVVVGVVVVVGLVVVVSVVVVVAEKQPRVSAALGSAAMGNRMLATGLPVNDGIRPKHRWICLSEGVKGGGGAGGGHTEPDLGLYPTPHCLLFSFYQILYW